MSSARRLPDRDIVYLADRASFPYGAKDRADLLAGAREVTVLGVRSLVDSHELAEFLRAEAGSAVDRCTINASVLVELVESGAS